ncbi:hypothetical protein AXF42_Ash006493 [Apostasia shenzhenica]|uniref:Uncharacterized protein n=1 Tax=Apostasia shenzhenica TaxID=1088818 RepID=A0A2I0AZ96_9ASPA|nr:hypothetical protein AXF42_Ash006493 [Apostasia shenzhenica]
MKAAAAAALKLRNAKGSELPSGARRRDPSVLPPPLPAGRPARRRSRRWGFGICYKGVSPHVISTETEAKSRRGSSRGYAMATFFIYVGISLALDWFASSKDMRRSPSSAFFSAFRGTGSTCI